MLFISYIKLYYKDLSSIIIKSDGRQHGKKGKKEILKFEYLEYEKSFLDKIKNFFHSF